MTMDAMRKYGLLALFYVAPVLAVHLVARFFWTDDRATDNSSVTVFEMLFTMLILPIYLLVLNYIIGDRLKLNNRVGIWTLMILAVGLSTLLHFRNWADKVGSWMNSDTETLAMMQLEFLVGSVVIVIGTAATLIKNRLQ